MCGCRALGPRTWVVDEVSAQVAQIDEQRLKWIFSLFPAVENFWNHPAGKLSGGQ